MVKSVFDSGKEEIDRAIVVSKLKKSGHILKFIAIFNDGKVLMDD